MSYNGGIWRFIIWVSHHHQSIARVNRKRCYVPKLQGEIIIFFVKQIWLLQHYYKCWTLPIFYHFLWLSTCYMIHYDFVAEAVLLTWSSNATTIMHSVSGFKQHCLCDTRTDVFKTLRSVCTKKLDQVLS